MRLSSNGIDKWMPGLKGHWIKMTGLWFVLLVFAFGAEPARAQQSQNPERQLPQARSEITLSFAPIVKKIAGSVVNVYGSRRETRGRPALFDDPIFREFFGGSPSQERVQQSVGSGVIVSSEGIVVTNHHVIEGMTEVKIALADKREFEADIILRDPRTDLAVLKSRPQKNSPVSRSVIRMAWKWAISCWPLATRLVSAKP